MAPAQDLGAQLFLGDGSGPELVDDVFGAPAVLAARLQGLGTLELLVELEFLGALGVAFVDGIAQPLLPAPRLIGRHPV